ncbi:MAG: electron transport complex subunit RsxG [Alteromonadaceae bacterium]|nr:MAG: electron transport complex subunit RsxG [Alteromonadaceae bacterium]
MLGQSITKNSLILGGFAVVTAGVLAFTFSLTADKIAEEEKRAATRALSEIMPAHLYDNDLLSNTREIPLEQQQLLGLEGDEKIYIATLNGQTTAIIVPMIAHDGYSGAIKLIAGIQKNGQITGVRVLSHRETPGLGDKIDINKNDWITTFDGKSLTRPKSERWAVKKDGGEFDQFTGATITPRAVVNRVKQTLTYFKKHRVQFFSQNDGNSSGQEN